MRRFLFCVLACGLAASAVQAAEAPSFKEVFEQTLPGIGAENVADRKEPQQKLQSACFNLAGHENQRAEACRLMAAKIGSGTPKQARLWLLKQLEFSGRDECVAALAAQLGDNDAEVVDWARRALEHNPAPAAGAALLTKLEASSGAARVAWINSLGGRGAAASVPALAKLLTDADNAVVTAAVAALGQVGTAEAAEKIAPLAGSNTPEVAAAAIDAHLRCADRLLQAGKTDQALAIYSKYAGHASRPARLAAITGQLRVAGDAAQVVALLGSADADARNLAAGYVDQLPKSATAALVAAFDKLPPQGQVLLIGALATKGEKAALPAAVAAAKSSNSTVRLAGFAALGKLGDASVVPQLIEAALSGGDTAAAARESLQQLVGAGVDEALLAAMKRADPAPKVTLLEILDKRRAAIVVPVLLLDAAGKNADLQARAIKVLGNLADAKDVPAMVKLLLAAPVGRQRDEIEKAVMFICNRIDAEDKQADPVLAIIDASSPEDQAALFPVLGRIGGPAAQERILAVIRGGNAELRDAAVRGLCNWPNATVADDLLKLATLSSDGDHKVSALRAYVRVVTLPTPERKDLQTLEALKKAMSLASRDDEKKLILSRVAANARHVQTLRWVLPYLDDAALRNEAAKAIVELGHRKELLEPNKKEFTPALNKVIEVCTDRGVVDRAQRILRGQ